MAEREVSKKAKEWRVYKPKKTNDGAASKLELKVTITQKTVNNKTFPVRKVDIFWVSSKQTGVDANDNASFGWDDEALSVVLKLGEVDLGEILAVLNGDKRATGAENGKFAGSLFHQNEKGNSSFALSRADNNNGYYLKVSKKVGGGAPIQISHTLSISEGQILKLVVEAAVRQIYQW